MNVLKLVFNLLVFPGFLFMMVVGLLLAGIDRKLVARMQKRIGPPITQPFYDFMKLMGKETIVPEQANKKVFLGAPVVGLVALVVMMLFIPVFSYSSLSTNSDLIVILYLLTIPGVAMIIGGSSSGSPFAGIGISREMVTMIGYELPLILILLAVARVAGGNELCFSLQKIISFQQSNGNLVFHWAMIPAAVAMLLVIPAEVGMHPFDVAEAETEICEGSLVEYSGAPLAVFKLTTAMKMLVMTSLFTMLFFGGINTGNVALNALILVVLCICVTIVSMTLVHAVTARLKVEQLFKFYWTIVTALAAISLFLVWMGL